MRLSLLFLFALSAIRAQSSQTEEVQPEPSPPLPAESWQLPKLGPSPILPGRYRVTQAETFRFGEEEFLRVNLRAEHSLDHASCRTDPSSGVRSRASTPQILGLAGLATTLAAGFSVSQVSQDKLKHLLVGYAAGGLTAGTLQIVLPGTLKHRKLYAFLGGLGASVLVGAVKELRDSRGRGTPEVADAAVTGLGGLGGSLVISIGDLKKR